MAPRLEFQQLLERLLGSRNVYFQPNENTRMQYPAIVYKRDNLATQHANNDPYVTTTGYEVTSIDPDPDSETPVKLSRIRTSRFARSFTEDGLNHEIYSIYY